MKILIMIDSFKGSLSSSEAGNIIKDEIEKLNPREDITVLPVADGGEGTVESMSELDGASLIEVQVENPLFETIIGNYVIIKDKNLAIMEMSQAAGLILIKDRFSPLKASTYGVGTMIKDALDKGIRNFIIGIGGSATNDGGIGMLSALGFKFYDKNNNNIHPSNEGLGSLSAIDLSQADPRLKEATFKIACDVDNPLTGKRGSASVYGPQKGANPREVEIIDNNLSLFHKKTLEVIENADDTYPGVGAAGGLGYAFKNYLGAELSPGIELILQMLNVNDYLSNADLVITGEGKIDFQSSMGKAPTGVAKLAKKYGANVIAFAGVVDNDAIEVNKHGIDAFFPILDQIRTVEEAMDAKKAEENLRRCVNQVFRLIYLYKN
ncbi:glycerate kinase [Anaerococcus sp. Marseille-Q7828]|uniref:glycerate kinase n=1 Tax=Anaerococcus sp. Marseille-Q7828 TaxID=3036300 RepID=UPI0024ADD3AA|nr:glycerate kinase [Anaerococcus sp. Marseille-Q7828]